MVKPVDDSCYDAELLDALLEEKEVDSTLVSPPPFSTAESGVVSTGHCCGPDVKFEHPRLFMIGGSLFSRYRRRLFTPRGRTRICGAHLSWLNYSSIFCPFTKQFVSTRSPHWGHLVSAGFGVARELRFGRSVVLSRPRQMQELAARLQELSGQDCGSCKSCTASWSPSLQRTLGALLESPPHNDESSLLQRVQEALGKEGKGGSVRRVIPIDLYDCASWAKRAALSAQNSKEEIPPPGDGAGSSDLFTVGENCLLRAQAWRTAVLQHRPKVQVPVFLEAADQTVGPVPDSPALQTSQSRGGLLIERYSSLNAVHHCIPGGPMACLTVQYNPDIPLMHIVVDALLRTEDGECVFYCPIEHGVDCHTIMDIVAYRVRRTESGDVEIFDHSPVLHLGLHTGVVDHPAASTVVVVGNAHLLSKRAIARLLDQWTRNGAASIAVRGGNTGGNEGDDFGSNEGEVAGHKRRGRELLLRIGDPFRAIACGVPLFGNVRALFVAYSGLGCDVDGDDDTGANPRVVPSDNLAYVRTANATVCVLSPLKEPVFYLEEPLVAALMRVAPTFQNRMDVVDRRAVVEELCNAMFGAFMVSSVGALGRLRGRAEPACDSYNEGDALLELREALEAFLSCPVKHGGSGILSSAHLMTEYPRLATARVRHELIREFPLRVWLNKKELVICRAVLTPPSVADVGWAAGGPCARGPVKQRDISVLGSRHLARKRAEEDHEVLKRKYVLDATLERVGFASVNKCGSERLSPPPQHCSSIYQGKCVLEHKYQPFFEPPVLLGRWTRTLLFCAPMVADMVALRCVLLHAVRELHQDKNAFDVVDVDVFCVDYVKYAAERRCNLFGVRLRFTARSGIAVATVKDGSAREHATQVLGDALVDCAIKAQLFPLWTSSTQLHQLRNRCHTVQANVKASGVSTGFQFESLDESVCAAQPNVVEQRLFALGFGQCGPLCLTVGTRVIALRDISSTIKRGTLCHVVRFASMPVTQELGASEARLIECFFEQQSVKACGARVLPVVRPIVTPCTSQPNRSGVAQEGEGEVGGEEALVTPVVSVVGGYRSLPHYALPALQLPLLAPCQCTAASTLFHPLFTHEGSLLEFASAATRSEAVVVMMSMASSFQAWRGVSCSFLYDAVFEGVESSTTPHKMDDKTSGYGNGCIEPSVPVVSCDALSSLSLFPLRG